MSKKPLSKADTLAALKAHAEAQAALDAREIELVQLAYKTHKVSIEEVAKVLGISVRTAYNRVGGRGPRTGTAWR